MCVCIQALQALQRQPNAAQYFQQLMLHQQINSAQLHNFAAVQQVRPPLTSLTSLYLSNVGHLHLTSPQFPSYLLYLHYLLSLLYLIYLLL